MLACFFQGLTCFLLASTSRSLQIFLRVLDGSIMSSTKPKTNVWPVRKRRVYWCTRYKRSGFLVYLWQQLGRGWRTSPHIQPLPQPGSPFLWRWSEQHPETDRKKETMHTVKSKGRQIDRDKQNKWACLYLCTHDSNLSWGPGVVHISSQVFGAHHVIGSSVSLGHTHTNAHTLSSDCFPDLKYTPICFYTWQHSFLNLRFHCTSEGHSKYFLICWSEVEKQPLSQCTALFTLNRTQYFSENINMSSKD